MNNIYMDLCLEPNIYEDLKQKLLKRLNNIEIEKGKYTQNGIIDGKKYELQTFRFILSDIFDDYIIDNVKGYLITFEEIEKFNHILPKYKFSEEFKEKLVNKIYNELYKNLNGLIKFRCFFNVLVAFTSDEINKAKNDKNYLPKIQIGFRTRYVCFNNEKGNSEFEPSKVYKTL